MSRYVYTEENIKKEIPLIDNEYEYIKMIDFKNGSSKILIRHKKCGRELEIRFGNFKFLNRRCKYCKGNKIDHKKFLEKVSKSKDGNEYEFLEEYKNSITHLKVKHKLCGKIYKVTPSDFLYGGSRCTKCQNCEKYDINTLKKKIKDIDSEYKLIAVSKKIGVREKIKLLHKKCGTKFVLITRNFITNNQRCPKCTKHYLPLIGKNHKRVEEWLIKNNIEYETEKRMKGLKSPLSNRPLRFDFYIKKYNLVIEYDGKHHKEISNIINEERLKRIKLHDKVKNNFCKENNIKLLRIHHKYENDDIDIILENYFLKNKFKKK